MKNIHARKNRRLMPALASLVVVIGLGRGADAHAQVVKGSGTTNDIPVWTGSTTIGNSLMKQSGTNINVSGRLVAATLVGDGSGVTNVNAAKLAGLLPSAFAQVGISNTFTADQTINGNLGLTGSINNMLTLQGNLTFGQGTESANVIGGFGGNSQFPGNSVASGVVGATIAGGGGASNGASLPNTVSGNWGTVGGGSGNLAYNWFSTVAGGRSNTATGTAGTVGGGDGNFADADYATVAGGTLNQANGQYSMVPGGYKNFAEGTASFAAGTQAIAIHDGSFVWNDGSAGIVTDTGPQQFIAQASGGFTFYSAPCCLTGATLAAGSGSWSTLSDRDAKANFNAVDGQAILSRLAALPIATWNYKAQPDSIRHMGPTAQDFREAFGLGEDERHISTVDAQGVALAAIQALYETVTEQNQQIVDLRARLAHLEQHQ